MASITSLGVGSGLDLSSIISGLVNAERAPTENRLSFKEQNLSTELSAFGLLRSSLSLFQSSLSGLKSSTAFNAKNITMSDDSVFSTSVENYADPGSYTVEVTAIAKAHSLASSAATAFSDVDDTVGSGTLTLRFGTTSTDPYSFTPDTSKATQTITVSAANNNTTLSGLRDYINDNDYGVQAAIVDDGSGYRLVLTSESTGASNSMEIVVSGDGDGNDNDNAGLSQLAFNASAQGSMLQTVSAQDAALSINGLEITRENNTVSGAINGVTLNLLKADVGNTISVNVSEDVEAVKTSIQEFVAAYNGLVLNVNSLTDFDAETGAAGVLIGDFTVRSISRQLRNILYSSVSGLSGNIQSLTDIGIRTNSNGTLKIDASKLDQALINFPDEVEALFSLQGQATDPDVRYVKATDDTQAGEYAVNISTLASRGVLTGSAVNSLIVDGNNDTFAIRVNGTTSGTITLTQGTYADGDALAAEIQAQINDDSSLQASEALVSVVYDNLNNRFEITSTQYGSDSTVEITAVDSNTGADLGLSVGSGTAGSDIAGTINGLSAIGAGQVLTSQLGNSKGLALEILSGATGARGNVTFSKGIASSIDALIGQFLQTGGSLSTRENGLKEDLQDINEQRDKLDQRISSLEARLIKQFSALDSLIAQFNSTSSFLTQQLANLPEPNSISKNK